MTVINSVQDIADAFECSDFFIGKILFRDASGGISFQEVDDGIILRKNGNPPHKLEYPFTLYQLWNTLESVDQE